MFRKYSGRETVLRTSAYALVLALGACAAPGDQYAEFYNHPPKRQLVETETPYDRSMTCLRDWLADNRSDQNITLAVGSVRDATGKFTAEGDGAGNFITQGWGDIVTTAFYRTGAYHLVERQNTEVIEWELNMANKKRLGDVTNPNPNRPSIDTNGDGRVDMRQPWRAYQAGQFQGSDVVIQGSVNTLDFNVDSGGARARIYGVGPDVRIYESVVGFDLRAVDTKTTRVVANETVKKRILGYEVGGGAGLFLGSVLLDVQAGRKRTEPMNLALREMTKYVAFQMTKRLYGVPETVCTEPLTALEDTPAGAGTESPNT